MWTIVLIGELGSCIISLNIVAFVPLVVGKLIVSGSATSKLNVGKPILSSATIFLPLIIDTAIDDEGKEPANYVVDEIEMLLHYMFGMNRNLTGYTLTNGD